MLITTLRDFSFIISHAIDFFQCLQNDGTYETVPGSDFVITRVAFRDNSSKYYINDRLSNFTEVTRKLKGKGVDLDNNRFLILQVRYLLCGGCSLINKFVSMCLFLNFGSWVLSG